MRSGVNNSFLLPDDGVHAKIHLVVDDCLPDPACVDDGLLVLHLPIVHLKANKHCVIAACVQTDRVDADAMRFVGLARGVNYQRFLLSLHHVHEFLLLYGRDHDGPALGVDCEVVSCVWKDVPGVILRQPDLPKVSSWVFLKRLVRSS